MQALRSPDEIRDVNTRYHDLVADGYDAKWGIDFGARGRAQVLGKVRKLLADDPPERFPQALEIGCGTGYFGLNLLLGGVVSELTGADISAGMIAALEANASRLGLAGQVRGVCAPATRLPFAPESFDAVLGHAVLHHVPDLAATLRELWRVLRPGGRLLFAGEPSRLGDLAARVPKRAAQLTAPAWRALLHAAPSEHATGAAPLEHGADALERKVDIHTFRPAELERALRAAGFSAVTIRGEELLSSWFGWFNRTLEASAAPDGVPAAWRHYAFHGYLALQRLDRRALEPRLPAGAFYNLLLSARRA